MSSTSILVISDSHGNVHALSSVLKWTQNIGSDDLAAAAFLGDGYEDLALASARAGFDLPWYAVRGNGDFYYSIPDSTIVEISSRKIFMSHGNHYNVREGYKTIAAAARGAGAQAALFGHTHIPFCMTTDGIFLLNPGSISRPRAGSDCTFAVLKCPESGDFAARFYKLAYRGGEHIVEV